MKKLFPALALTALLGLTACGSSDAATGESATVEAVDRQEERQKWADDQYASFLSNYGVESQEELLAQNPASVQSYLVSAESPSSGTVIFTAQLTESDVDKSEIEQAAMAVLNLIGFSDESVDRVEIVTADNGVRGVANRNASPLLNS